VRRASRFALAACALTACAAFAQDDEQVFAGLKSEAKARVQNIQQNLNDWDVEGARDELKALEALVPNDLEPVNYFAGRVAFEEGRYDDAVSLLEKSGLEDTAGGYLRLAKETRAIVAPYERAESAHFVFLYPKGKDAVLVPWALEALEAARAAMEKDFGWAPKGKVRVEIVSNASELSKVSTLTREAIRTTGTIAICKFNKLMVTSPKAVLRGYDWLDTLAHEYVHLVVSQRSRNTVPIWMHEGLAKFLESRWRGPYGGAMTPSTLALLGSRLKQNTLVPFEKMHPSMALLPTAEDAATAFAEVFFAMDYLRAEAGDDAFARLLAEMAKGKDDKHAVEVVMKRPFAAFEKGWMAHLRKQPFPKGLIPLGISEKKQLAEDSPGKAKQEKAKKGRDVSFGDFAEVTEPEARRAAHLGEVLRERSRLASAAEEYAKAYAIVGGRYESVANKYAATLMELKQLDTARGVLEASLALHPLSAQTQVALGRLALRAKDWARARDAYTQAVSVNPFNPEVHVALYRAALGLNDAALKKRAGEAAVVLLKVTEKDLGELACGLSGEGGLEGLSPSPLEQGSEADAGPAVR
jgi:tetratricopeptide (TPR) repeat protein